MDGKQDPARAADGVGETPDPDDPRAPESDASLFRAVYAELHGLARRSMGGQPAGHTLQPTALVNEAYLRLAAAQGEWQGRVHFLRVAARAMRQILVDHSRRRSAEKRVPRERRMELDPLLDAMAADFETRSGDILGLDAALTKLAERDSRSAELVELHFFGGLTMDECAQTMGVSERQAYRWWQTARAFLHREVKG